MFTLLLSGPCSITPTYHDPSHPPCLKTAQGTCLLKNQNLFSSQIRQMCKKKEKNLSKLSFFPGMSHSTYWTVVHPQLDGFGRQQVFATWISAFSPQHLSEQHFKAGVLPPAPSEQHTARLAGGLCSAWFHAPSLSTMFSSSKIHCYTFRYQSHNPSF